MDLLERYLQAVGEHLPAGTRADTLAELRENLLAQLDARVEELGRPLTEAEVATILQAHGRPVLVAAPYLPQRYLIGPTVFPFYLMTLRKVAPFVALVYLFAQLSTFLLTQSAASVGAAIGRTSAQLIPTMLLFWGIVTLVFAILEFAQSQYGKGVDWKSWNPAELPPLAGDRQKERSLASRVTDLVVHCLWMAYVFAIPRHPYLVLGPGGGFMQKLSVDFAPMWHTYYVALIVLLIVQLGVKLMVLVRGSDRWKASIELASKLFGVLVVGFLATANAYLVPTSSAANLATLAVVNHWIGVGLRIALFFAIVDLAVEAWKYVGRHAPAQRLAF